jgi:hypothetical protein
MTRLPQGHRDCSIHLLSASSAKDNGKGGKEAKDTHETETEECCEPDVK